jgi:hypothetical protein
MGNMYVVMSKLKDRISTDNKHMIKYIKYIMRKIVLSLFAFYVSCVECTPSCYIMSLKRYIDAKRD